MVNAQYQHIVYNEFLPVILGLDTSLAHKLIPLKEGYRDTYQERGVDPRITNEFAAAAFRSGHSMIPSHFE